MGHLGERQNLVQEECGEGSYSSCVHHEGLWHISCSGRGFPPLQKPRETKRKCSCFIAPIPSCSETVNLKKATTFWFITQLALPSVRHTSSICQHVLKRLFLPSSQGVWERRECKICSKDNVLLFVGRSRKWSWSPSVPHGKRWMVEAVLHQPIPFF